MLPDRLLVTCEHGGNDVPPRYRYRFDGSEHLLATHEGYDAGALAMAEALADALAAPLVASTTTRLLVELNRSLGHPRLYSAASRSAPPAVRRDISPSSTCRTASAWNGMSRRRSPWMARSYVGIKLEVNQRFILHDVARWEAVRDSVIAGLQDALGIG